LKKILKVVLVSFIGFIILAGGFLFYLSRGLEAGNQLGINEIDLLSLNDGIYTGKYEGGRWSNEVEVEIKNHQITEIKLIKDVMFSKPEVIDELFNRVTKQQSIKVDTVAGATVTSKAYLKAIEIALKN
jgi:uncharacterized protein with FMN-binding domain